MSDRSGPSAYQIPTRPYGATATDWVRWGRENRFRGKWACGRDSYMWQRSSTWQETYGWPGVAAEPFTEEQRAAFLRFNRKHRPRPGTDADTKLRARLGIGPDDPWPEVP